MANQASGERGANTKFSCRTVARGAEGSGE
jgi:hypothetical protein